MIFLFCMTDKIKMPSGKFDKPVVTDNHDGTITFTYDPKEVGTHELQIKYNLENVQGKQTGNSVNSVLLIILSMSLHELFYKIKNRLKKNQTA